MKASQPRPDPLNTIMTFSLAIFILATSVRRLERFILHLLQEDDDSTIIARARLEVDAPPTILCSTVGLDALTVFWTTRDMESTIVLLAIYGVHLDRVS